MDKGRHDRAHARIISTLCVVVLSSILVAGLWPFHTPRNGVSWLKVQNGLRFSGHGAAISSGAFRIRGPRDETGCSLEIWLVPGRTNGAGSILAFDSSPDPRAPFLLRQYGPSIALQRYLIDQQGRVTHPWFRVKGVFQGGQRVLVTITSGKRNTDLYVNGVLAGTSSDPGIIGRELTGRLLLANSTVDDGWSGSIMGLAVYDRELSPAQVVRYLFNEREGNTVRNQFDAATDLIIPAKYFVLHQAFLGTNWNQYSPSGSVWRLGSSWEDLSINILGFVPVGFVFFAYFSSVKRLGQPAPLVILLGFFLSFTVEALQRLLPTRDSGMNDLVTNTAGTALGVLLYRVSFVQTLWANRVSFVLPLEAHPEALVAHVEEKKLTLSA
jgi:hypothetical protein